LVEGYATGGSEGKIMTESTKRKVGLVLGVLFLVLAVIIFVFADGLRRWYSGIFFAIIGALTLLNALHRKEGVEE
jgi:hypothetical protein